MDVGAIQGPISSLRPQVDPSAAGIRRDQPQPKDSPLGQRPVTQGDDSVELGGSSVNDSTRGQTRGLSVDQDGRYRLAPLGEESNSNTNPNSESNAANSTESQEETQIKPGEERRPNGEPLTEDETRQVDDLEKRDREVREHEQAHKAAAGELAKGGPSYDYELGPNGKRYAVGGEVKIDTSPEDDPQDTITKMQRVRRAALAPAEPSNEDRQVAAKASQQESAARQELRAARLSEQFDRGEGNRVPGFEEPDLGYSSPVEAFGRLNESNSISSSLRDVTNAEREFFNKPGTSESDPIFEAIGREFGRLDRENERISRAFSARLDPVGEELDLFV